MKHRLNTLVLPVLLAVCGAVQADTLLVDRASQKPAEATPARGLGMAEVEARFGAPQQKLDPRGGQKRQWPAIHRWVYPEFVVYFEKNQVIDVVARQASAAEAGPKPPIR